MVVNRKARGAIEFQDLKSDEMLFKDFVGIRSDRNLSGIKGFAIKLPDDIAEQLHVEGWDIKDWLPKDSPVPIHLLNVTISYENDRYLPSVAMVVGRTCTILDNDTLRNLSEVYIERADMILSPYTSKKSGLKKAYIREANFYIEESDIIAARTFVDDAKEDDQF